MGGAFRVSFAVCFLPFFCSVLNMSVTVPGEVTVLEPQIGGTCWLSWVPANWGVKLPKPNLALTLIGLVSWASSA